MSLDGDKIITRVSRYADADTCLGGCGKQVLNRSGICFNCRRKSCKTCGSLFSPKPHSMNLLCSRCQCGDKKIVNNYSEVPS
jgi:hypothetical protein